MPLLRVRYKLTVPGIACGLVYHTNTKSMPWIPHRPTGFSYWRTVLDYPLVAIGGISQKRIKAMLDQKADGIAIISAITQASDPDDITRKFLKLINDSQASPASRLTP